MRDFAYKLVFRSLGGAADAVRAYKPTIFCFHSVTNARSQDGFASRISVSDAFLERLILDLRRRNIAIVSLAEALSRLAGGDAAPFVVLTFDDGYADNYHNLYPVMRKHGAPFTIFVTTGLIDRTLPMWWDAIERLECKSDIVVPEHLLQKPGDAGHADLDSVTDLFRFSGRDPNAVLADLHRHNASLDLDLAYTSALTWPMLREMHDSGLLTVGAHTVDHVLLSKLSYDQAFSQIAGSRKRIEEELDIAVPYFAYPFGQDWEIGEAAFKATEQAGFAAAFTTEATPLSAADLARPFRMPRVLLASKAQQTHVVRAYMSGLPRLMNNFVGRT